LKAGGFFGFWKSKVNPTILAASIGDESKIKQLPLNIAIKKGYKSIVKLLAPLHKENTIESLVKAHKSRTEMVEILKKYIS